MFKTKCFITGFCLSFCTVSIIVSSHNQQQNQNPHVNTKTVKINLHKQNKQSFPVISLNDSVKKITNIKKSYTTIAQNTIDKNIDEEILSINISNEIPIDFNNTLLDNKKNLITTSSNENLSASLPQDAITKTPKETTNNKKNSIKEDITELVSNNKHKLLLPGDNVIDDSISYKVAERIKESVLFPISEEILNDENLTPTFINKKRTSKPNEKKQKETKITKKDIEKKPIKTTTAVNNTNKQEKPNSFLNNLSALFSKKEETDKSQKPKKQAPTYSSKKASQLEIKSTTSQTKAKNSQLGSFYEALQETQLEHEVKNILPKELSLQFNPNKAEISGKTLRWIKAFSERANETNKQLQIILANNTNIELQEKRLKFLYTLLANTNIDPSYINIKLANIDTDTFIIMITDNPQEM